VNRSIIVLAIAFATVAIIAPTPAQAQQPSPADITKAKAAFGEGKKLFDAGDFAEAAAKFKESYKLSKNPVLLYNIGFANEKAGQDDIALFYYRKFLTDAPPEAAQRAEVVDKVKELEKKFSPGGGGSEPVKTEPVKTEPVKTEPLKIKPAGTYKDTDFQHQMIDTAPPKKPLDITAFVPEDSGWTVTLHFRTAGEGKFTSKEMKWRYKELVGRVPAQKMLGESMQYYIEVKDQAGVTIARAGKSTSPNLVTLEAGASPRFYPDFSEEGTVATPQETIGDDTEEDPLTGKKKTIKKVAVVPGDGEVIDDPTPTGGQGLTDVGSKKFKYAKWGSTGAAVGLVGLSVTFYFLAGKQATALEDDSLICGAPPCRMFDQYDRDLESAGKRNQSISNTTMVLGIGAAAVAGYFWYKQLTSKKTNTERMSTKKAADPELSWTIVPSLDDTSMGATAAVRF
jgi:hypothetical protein